MILGKLVAVDFDSSTLSKEKKHLIQLLTSNNLQVSFILNKKVDFLLKDNENNLDTYKCRTAFKLGIPVVHINFVRDYFINYDDPSGLDIKSYFIKDLKKEENFKKGKIGSTESNTSQTLRPLDIKKLKMVKINEDTFNDSFEAKGYNVIKWSIFKVEPNFSFEFYQKNSIRDTINACL